MDAFIQALKRVNTVVACFCGYAAGALLAGMLAVVVVHVFFRYVLNSGFAWTEELSRTMMVWMGFLYFPTAHRKALNVSLDLFVATIEKTVVHRWIGLVIELAIFLLLCGAVYYSYNLAAGAARSETLALRIPLIYVYAIMPVGFALVALCSLERLLQIAGNLIDPGRYEVHVFGGSTGADA
ncbi:TRAP transporter small permease [Nitratireductor sp. GCM10026969]|uniref:TRAP transporter small permease n=1 Tax=Nitratireductor sp. GCM10026969 TaxID=3252645 RepID=UPI00360787BD